MCLANSSSDMERKADVGSISSYGGAVHVILHFRTAEGSERRVRFHPEGCGTIGRQAKAMNAVAASIQAWQGQPRSESPQRHIGETPEPVPRPHIARPCSEAS